MHLGTFVVFAVLHAMLWVPCCVAETDFEDRSNRIDAQQLEEPLSRAGWLRLGFDDVPNTEFAMADESIQIAADASNALIYRQLSEVETEAQFMSWSWRVDSLPPSKSLTRVDDDDRAIAVYVIFEIEPRKLSLWGRIRSSLVARFSGLPKGQILTYVWGNEDTVGNWFPNPYIRGTGRVKVLRNATHSLGVWQSERIDLASDFVAAFGYEPVRPIYIALSADTEDSGTKSLSWIRHIRLASDELNEPFEKDQRDGQDVGDEL